MASKLDELMAEINSAYGKFTIVNAKSSTALGKVDRIPTGILAFDIASGGGIPRGMITQFRGEYSSGKSLLALRSAAAIQRMCRNCRRPMGLWDEGRMTFKASLCCRSPAKSRVVWYDAEGSFRNDWATRMGLDVEAAWVIQPEYAEQGIDVADKLLRSQEVDMLVIDSIAALTPTVEIEESAEKWQMGVHARLMNKMMRKIQSALNKGGIDTPAPTVVMINQIRLKVGVVYGNPETTPGGKGTEFGAAIIAKVKRKSYDTEPGSEIIRGTNMEVQFIKNKTHIPGRTAAFSITFTNKSFDRKSGSSNIGEQAVALGVYHGLVKQQGAWFTVAEGHKYHGLEAAAKAVEAAENINLLKMLTAEIVARESNILDAPPSL